MLIIRLEGEGALDLHSREFHVVQQHSIWGGPLGLDPNPHWAALRLHYHWHLCGKKR